MKRHFWISEIRQAVLVWRRRPALAVTICLTMTLGLGGAAAILAIADVAILRPLPYPDADRIVMLFRTVPQFGFERSTVSYPDYRDWAEEAPIFDETAAYGRAREVFLSREGAQQWNGARTTNSLFSLLRVPPLQGRIFSADEDRPGGPPVILLSHSLWQSRLGGQKDILGSTLRFADGPRTVIGIMPKDFLFPNRETLFWIPLQGDLQRMERDTNFLTALGRLKAGVTVPGAQAVLSEVAARIDSQAVQGNRDLGVFVERRRDFLAGSSRAIVWVLLAAVGLLLLIACLNVANLLLFRLQGRRVELGVRAALGAARYQIFRLLVAEGLLLAFLGGMGGIVLAWGLVNLLEKSNILRITHYPQIPLTTFTIALSLAMALLFGLAFGLLSTWFGSRSALWTWSGARAGEKRRTTRVQGLLVSLQIALAFVLLSSTGLLLNSLLQLTKQHPGFSPSKVWVGRVEPRLREAPGSPDDFERMAASRIRFFEDFHERLQQRPRVDLASLAYSVPFTAHGFSTELLPEGRTESQDGLTVDGNVVSGDYFAALEIPLLAGRTFSSEDRLDSPAVIILSQSLSEILWPNQSALGRQTFVGSGRSRLATVVGIVGDLKTRALSEQPEPRFYLPVSQTPWAEALFVIARSSTEDPALAETIRSVALEVDEALPVTELARLSEFIDSSVQSPRARLIVVGLCGIFALLLAAVGIFGIVSYFVAHRTRELGIRMALGAQSRGILYWILGRAIGMLAIGVALVLPILVWTTQLLEGLLFQLAPHDPATLAGSFLILSFVVLSAAYLPARRGAGIDPANSLRHR